MQCEGTDANRRGESIEPAQQEVVERQLSMAVTLAVWVQKRFCQSFQLAIHMGLENVNDDRSLQK
jgi:hypothetical protein